MIVMHSKHLDSALSPHYLDPSLDAKFWNHIKIDSAFKVNAVPVIIVVVRFINLLAPAVVDVH